MDMYIRYAEGASVLQSEDQVQHSGLKIAAPAEIRVCRAPVLEGNGRAHAARTYDSRAARGNPGITPRGFGTALTQLTSASAAHEVL